MSAPRKLPSVNRFKAMTAAEPLITMPEVAARYGVTQQAVWYLCRKAGGKLVRAKPWSKATQGIRLTADHVAVADSIVSTAAHRLTDFRMTVETPEDRKVIDAAISGLDDLSTVLRSGDTSFLNRSDLEQPK